MRSFCLAAVVLFSCFSLLLTGAPQRMYKHNPTSKRTGDTAKAKEKQERQLQKREKTRQLQLQAAALNQELPSNQADAVNVQVNETSLNSRTAYDGDFVALGTCTNNGNASAVFLEVKVKLYDKSGSYIDYEWNYVQGGTNVKLSGTGSYTRALRPGETGFFEVNTDYPSSRIGSYEVSFSWDTYGHAAAHAPVSFDGAPSWGSNYFGDLRVTGNVKNASSALVTYFTEIDFAILNAAGKVLEVDFNYVDGSTYTHEYGSTDTSIYPWQSEPFANTFSNTRYSEKDSFLYSFEWDEESVSQFPEKDRPFGSFDSPENNAHVSSSIAVTGWALDDSGVDKVTIWRKTNGQMVLIGDAVFVEGARTDIPSKHPDHLNNTKAGWGYMMLTNFLPNGGNGTYEIYAIATDAFGKTKELGKKTIHVDNANAVSLSAPSTRRPRAEPRQAPSSSTGAGR